MQVSLGNLGNSSNSQSISIIDSISIDSIGIKRRSLKYPYKLSQIIIFMGQLSKSILNRYFKYMYILSIFKKYYLSKNTNLLRIYVQVWLNALRSRICLCRAHVETLHIYIQYSEATNLFTLRKIWQMCIIQMSSSQPSTYFC